MQIKSETVISCSSRKKKSRHFFHSLFCLKVYGFLNMYVLSQCVVYQMHCQNIHTFTCQKKLLHTYCMFLKLPKDFSVSLRMEIIILRPFHHFWNYNTASLHHVSFSCLVLTLQQILIKEDLISIPSELIQLIFLNVGQITK